MEINCKNSRNGILRKEERFMSMINLFLQKRKMHESHHGVIMIVTAYVLSVMMLIMGSDIFYNINTTAAGLNMDTDEETQDKLKELSPDLLTTDFKTPILQSKLTIPYGFAEITEMGLGETLEQNTSLSGDTIWLLGSAMNYEEYNSLMEKMNSFDVAENTDQTSEKAEEKAEKKAGKKTSEKKLTDTTKSLSTEEANSSAFMAVTEEEVDMLERIVAAEATGEDMIGKILIANVVFNRMADDNFPNTIEDVIFQEVDGDYQFSPVSDERYWSVKVTDETEEAVQRALQGEDYSEGALYFIARKRTKSSSAKWFDQHLDWLFKHGGHEFYKNK
jgi:N-acetylmuramoyl-L-alanine amidase